MTLTGAQEVFLPKLNDKELDDKKKAGCKALFDLSNVKEGLSAVLKKRPNNQRTLLLLAILIFELEIFIIVR